ncbi:MAG TPA: zf-HC2 domain-containing protein [Pyrinomonadaceae bacterium]|nr:zf-HC2 domain-containing protein [Pyrinomonadaceae bacterium]
MNCLDEGLLQALTDGELSAERKREAETHLASCASCAAALAGAAQEFTLFSQAFAVDESLSVPTERLRANITSAIAEMQTAQAAQGFVVRGSSGGHVRSFWSSLAASFAPRQIAVFASLALAAVVLAATFFALRPGPQTGNDGPREIATSNKPAGQSGKETPDAKPAPSPAIVEAGPQSEPGGAANAEELAKIRPKNAGSEMAKIRPKGAGEAGKFRPKIVDTDRGGAEVAAATPRPKIPQPELLPVERQYAREIAALKTSIERQKLQTLSPTLRAEYERNVAVVDEAIASTRAAVKSNPKDLDAQEFLRAAYQDKLDLLSAVAGKSELASADR